MDFIQDIRVLNRGLPGESLTYGFQVCKFLKLLNNSKPGKNKAKGVTISRQSQRDDILNIEMIRTCSQNGRQ
jgi:hypothetical protein